MVELRKIALLGLALLAYSQCICQTVESRTPVMPEPSIHAQLSIAGVTKSEVSFDLEIVNSGANSVYAVIDPINSDDSKGPSLSVSNEAASTLQIEVRLFGPPSYNLYMNGARVRMKLLRPGEKCVQHFSLPLPLHYTEPPYEWAKRGQRISAESLTHAQAVVGILPDALEIRQLMRSESSSQALTGLELIRQGSSTIELYRAQTLYYSHSVPLSLVPQNHGAAALGHESDQVDPPKEQ